jgi:hypothetical protein
MHRASLYLLLAVVGAVVPYLFFFDHFLAEGVDLPGFVRALFVNGAAGGFAADLLIASPVFWLFMVRDAREHEVGAVWPFVVLNLTIGLSCALPAYLWRRERVGRAAPHRAQ